MTATDAQVGVITREGERSYAGAGGSRRWRRVTMTELEHQQIALSDANGARHLILERSLITASCAPALTPIQETPDLTQALSLGDCLPHRLYSAALRL